MQEIVKQHDNRFDDIFVQTIEDMKNLGTYKQEFSPVISRYVEMRLQFEILMQNWYEDDCKITEVYINKAGAANNRKTALYQAIENIRKEITDLENLLGLTPAGLKKINDKSMAGKQKSILGEVLKNLEQK